MEVRFIVSLVLALLMSNTNYSATAQAMADSGQSSESAVQCEVEQLTTACQAVSIQYFTTVEWWQRDAWQKNAGIERGQEWVSYMLYPGPALETPLRIPIACTVAALGEADATVRCSVNNERTEVWRVNLQTLEPRELEVKFGDESVQRFIFQ